MTYSATYPNYGHGQSGWYCPSCQKHHAPSVITCPNPTPTVWGGTDTMPFAPQQSYTYRCPSCGSKAGCTCVVLINEIV